MAFHALIFAGYNTLAVYTKPLGAHIIASSLRSANLTSLVIDYALYSPIDVVRSWIQKFGGPDTKFVCISTTLMSRSTRWVLDPEAKYLALLSAVRELLPQAKIILGGSDINGFSAPVDYKVQGQGESALLAIVNHELYGEELVYDTLKDGTRLLTDTIYGVSDFNTDSKLIYDPRYDCVAPKQPVPIEFGRGCVFRCSYCNYAILGKEASEFTKSEEVLYQSIMSVYDAFGTEAFVFVDDTINDSLDKALTLQKVVRRLPFKFQFGGYMRLELFHKHKEMAEIYAECGLRSPSFGIETFNKAAGQTVGKGFGEKAKDVLDYLMSVWGLEVSIALNFIVGLPYDTRDHLQAQHRWLMSRPNLGFVNYSGLTLTNADSAGFLSGHLNSYYKNNGLMSGSRYVLNWETEIMNRSDAVHLADKMNQEYDATRKRLGHRLGSFALLSSLSENTWESLMSVNNPLTLKDFYTRSGESRYASYQERLALVVPPSSEIPDQAIKVQAGEGVFVTRMKTKFISNRGKITVARA